MAATLAAGCGDATIDRSDVESGIRHRFAAHGVRLHDVTCPDHTKAEAGASLTCTARNAPGTKLIIGGLVTRVDGDQASFHFQAAHGVASGATMGRQVQALLERKVGQRARGMTCPSRIRIPTTPAVTCRLTTLDGKVYDTKVTVDDTGAVNAYVAKHPISSP